jgi:hypothetical protein
LGESSTSPGSEANKFVIGVCFVLKILDLNKPLESVLITSRDFDAV